MRKVQVKASKKKKKVVTSLDMTGGYIGRKPT